MKIPDSPAAVKLYIKRFDITLATNGNAIGKAIGTEAKSEDLPFINSHLPRGLGNCVQ